jgi:hypothetical protein
MSECILVYRGFARSPGWCHVVVAHDQAGGTAVLVGELDDNPGTAVTNALEQIADIVRRELVDGDSDFVLYEYVPKAPPKLEPVFYRIEWRGEPARFSMPTWEPVDPKADQWVRYFRGKVTDREYTSRALIAQRGLEVLDAREREDLPSAR